MYPFTSPDWEGPPPLTAELLSFQNKTMTPKYKAPRGTQDVLPEVSWRWQRVEAAFRDVCRRYGYGEIRTPLFEETDLFVRGVGEGTEIVTKQMYTFEDRGGRSLTLRAEGTAPVVRAYLEHNLGAGGRVQKLYYIAPIFRYERPQAGRYRQHNQLGLEAIGAPGPDIDAEIIALYHDFLKEIGLTGASTHLSSIGCPKCRPVLNTALREFFAPKLSELCEFCQARYETNPLRILDCKVPHDVEARKGAPSALDHLCEECRTHFDGVRATLDLLGVVYEIDPTIVRGLDYYTRTAFEVVHPGLGAKDVIMGGGRYDGLAEMLGGPPTPGIGFGSGLERLMLVLEAQPTQPEELLDIGGHFSPPKLNFYIATQSPESKPDALGLAKLLRKSGLSVDLNFIPRSLKAQMKYASGIGAHHVVIFKTRGLDLVTLRDMESGAQQTVSLNDALSYAKKQRLVTQLLDYLRSAIDNADEDAAENVVKELNTILPSLRKDTPVLDFIFALRMEDFADHSRANPHTAQQRYLDAFKVYESMRESIHSLSYRSAITSALERLVVAFEQLNDVKHAMDARNLATEISKHPKNEAP